MVGIRQRRQIGRLAVEAEQKEGAESFPTGWKDSGWLSFLGLLQQSTINCMV